MDDISSKYTQRRESARANAARDEVMAFLNATPAGAAPAAPAAPTAAAPTDQGEGAVMTTVRNAAEIPRAAAHGAVKGLNEMADAVTEFSSWIEETTGLDQLPGLRIGTDGVEVVSGEELKGLPRPSGARLPNVDAPETFTGGLVSGVSQFLAGFGVAGKALKGVTTTTKAGAVAKAAAQGAAADFAAFDGQEERLSNLIQQNPELRNPVTSYLAADPNDGEAEGRFKNALEGLGLGVVADGMVKGLRVLRAAREAKIESRRIPELDPANPDFSILGDASSNDFILRTGDDAAAPAGDAATGDETVASDATAGVADNATAPRASRWVVDGRGLWEMNLDELRGLVDREDAADREVLSRVFEDPDKVEQFLRYADSESDQMQARADRMLDGLTPEQRTLYDQWEQGLTSTLPSTDFLRLSRNEVSGLADAIDSVKGASGSMDDLVFELKWAITKLGGNLDPAEMSFDQMKALLQFRTAMEVAGEQGWDRAELSKRVINAAASRFSDPADAEFMLQRFLNPQPAAASRPAGQAALPGPGAAVPPSAAPGPDAAIPPGDPGMSKLRAGARQTEGTQPGDVLAGTEGQGAGEISGPGPKEPVFEINWARINSSDDVRQVMQNMADMNKSDIDMARRGTKSWETTQSTANLLDAWEILSSRRRGEPLNAERTVAARQLWASSASKLQDVATAAATNPSDANLVAFRKMLATHYAIQREVLAARTETARALNAWAIPVGEGKRSTELLKQMLLEGGGNEVNSDLARRIAALAQSGMFTELDRVVEAGVWAKTKDAVAQAWVNGLLTNPATHVVNAMSNWSVAALTVGERRVAAHLSRLMGAENGVEAGEAMYMTFGVVQGIRDAMRISAKGREVLASSAASLVRGDRAGAARGLRENAEEFGTAYRTLATGKTGAGVGKTDTRSVGGSLSAETWNVASDTWLGRGLDILDTATSAPGRALAVSDEFFKTIGYRMELNARALRQATQEARDDVALSSLSPAERAAAVKRRTAEILDNPPEDLKLAAIDAATYQTFTNKPAAVPKYAADGIQQIPILGRLLLPFKNTPINVMTFAFERTPFAPMIASWRADMAAGGARADIATARMATGTMVMLAAMDLALSGTVSGGGPKQGNEKQLQTRKGVQPYSVKVGDTWYSYSRADPLGMTMGLAADIVDIAANSDVSEDDMSKIMMAATLSVAKNVTSKTYMEGVSSFFDAVSDPDRYGEAWFLKLAGSTVPAGVAAIARLEDPYMRTAGDMVEAMKRRTPGLSDKLPKARDLWGRETDYRSGLGVAYDLFSPVYIKRENPEPIDLELERLGYYPAMPKKKFSYNGVEMDLEQHLDAYSRFVELAGNEIKDPAFGLGAKDFLNAIVSGKHPLSAVYNLMDDEKKENYIEAKLLDYRKAARDRIMREFPELRADYDAKRKPLFNGLP